MNGNGISVKSETGEVILQDCLWLETTLGVAQGLANKNKITYYVYDKHGECIGTAVPEED